MASRTASITSVLPLPLLLLLLLVVPSSSSYVKFDLHGSIHNGGYIYVRMKIGDQMYNLDVDTGSILTWLQCYNPSCKQGECQTWPQQNPLYKLKYDKLVHSTDPLCVELLQHPGSPGDYTCGYNIAYADGESSTGYLIRDKFTLPVASNAHHTIAFGCGYNQENFKPGQRLPVDGILGLGRGSAVKMALQLQKQNVITKDVISHCISAKGGGFLFIGDYKHPNVDWVPMDRNAKQVHYSPKVPGYLYFNGKLISEKPMKVVFDSGSTYTIFDRQPYEATEYQVIRSVAKSLTEVPGHGFKCWKGTRPFKSVDDVKPLFKPIFLVFQYESVKGHRKATLNIPPENYLFIKDGNVCFGILQHPAAGETNIIGGITMQDRTVIYDNEGGQIGWVHDSCKGKSESAIPSRL